MLTTTNSFTYEGGHTIVIRTRDEPKSHVFLYAYARYLVLNTMLTRQQSGIIMSGCSSALTM